MLSLTRRDGERTRLLLPSGEAIWLTCYRKQRGEFIQLVIDAPRAVEIAREELLPEAERWQDKASPS